MNLQNARLFISYSRKNRDFIEKLIDRLRNRCIVWYDQRLTPAEVWWTRILEEIEHCDCFVLLLTEHYIASAFCLSELEYAQKLGKPILSLVPDRGVKFPPNASHSQVAIIDGLDTPHVSQATGEIIIGISNLKPEQYTKSAVTVERPAEPTPTGQAQVSDVYADAVEAEAAGNYSLADRFYKQVVQLGSSKLRLLAEKRLKALEKRRGCINDYANITRLADHPTTLSAAIELWQVYLDDCGTEYDPRKFSQDARFTDQNEHLPGIGMIDVKGVHMVFVPRGKFLMGTDDMSDNEKPMHEVVIQHGFWLDLTPVTNESYTLFMTEGGYNTQQFWTAEGWEWVQANKDNAPRDYGDKFNDPQQPRVGVTWYESYAYCKWRNGRLPTEAEWEWAARGKNNFIYPWGNDFESDKVFWHENSDGKPARVGSKSVSASWVGALDMSGNVWEWMQTIFDQAQYAYPYHETDGRNSSNGVNARVMRGGSWRSQVRSLLRSAYRNKYAPDTVSDFMGFRVVRSID